MLNKEQLLANLDIISRTVSTGKIDTSTHTKKSLVLKKKNISKKIVFKNILRAVELLEQNLHTKFKSKQHIENFTIKLVSVLNDKILEQGKEFTLRTWDKPSIGLTPLATLQKDLDDFYSWLYLNINSVDAIKVAGLIEYRFNARLHPLADGCAKTSILLSSFILMRKGNDLPTYRSRKEHYKHFAGTESEWLKYYFSLFD